MTLVVPAAPGGLIDASARLVGDPLAKLMGQPVIVDNRSGGSGNVGYSQVAHAAADGHTLLASYSGYHVGNPALTDKLPWSQKDLMPVAMIAVAATNVDRSASVRAGLDAQGVRSTTSRRTRAR